MKVAAINKYGTGEFSSPSHPQLIYSGVVLSDEFSSLPNSVMDGTVGSACVTNDFNANFSSQPQVLVFGVAGHTERGLTSHVFHLKHLQDKASVFVDFLHVYGDGECAAKVCLPPLLLLYCIILYYYYIVLYYITMLYNR